MSLAERAILAVREMVHDGVLLPGQPVRQGAVAEQLGISRVPVREALKSLQADGLVEPSPSGGFVVVRLSGDELSQIYLMRRLLETEMLERIVDVPEAEIDVLTDLNVQMAQRIEKPDREWHALNRRFHFGMFALAGMRHVVVETARLWDQSAPYRSIYSSDRAVRDRIVGEHAQLLDALRRGDLAQLVRFMDAHRGASQVEVVSLLSRPSLPG